MSLTGKFSEVVLPMWCNGFPILEFSFCSLFDASFSNSYSVEKTNEAIDALHSGDCLRAVVKY
jgi:hypothetical protein